MGTVCGLGRGCFCDLYDLDAYDCLDTLTRAWHCWFADDRVWWFRPSYVFVVSVSVWDDASVKCRVYVLVSTLLFRMWIGTKGGANLSMFICPSLFLRRSISDWISLSSLKMSTSFLEIFFSRALFFVRASSSFSSSVRTCVCFLAMFSLFFFHDIESFCSNISIFLCYLLLSSLSAKIFFLTVVRFFWSGTVGLDTFKKEISSASETLKNGNSMAVSCRAMNMVHRFWSRFFLWVDFFLTTITFTSCSDTRIQALRWKMADFLAFETAPTQSFTLCQVSFVAYISATVASCVGHGARY